MYLELNLFTALLPLSATSYFGDDFSKPPRLKLLFSSLSSDLLLYPAISSLFFFFFFFAAASSLSLCTLFYMLLLLAPASCGWSFTWLAQDLEPLLRSVCCARALRQSGCRAVGWKARGESLATFSVRTMGHLLPLWRLVWTMTSSKLEVRIKKLEPRKREGSWHPNVCRKGRSQSPRLDGWGKDKYKKF